MLRMELPGKRRRGRPKRRFTGAVIERMAGFEVTEEDAEGRTDCRWRIHCGDPWREKSKEEEESNYNRGNYVSMYRVC